MKKKPLNKIKLARLFQNVTTVSYMTTRGKEVTIRGTLDPNKMSNVKSMADFETVLIPDSNSILSVWDVDNRSFHSFRIDSVIVINGEKV